MASHYTYQGKRGISLIIYRYFSFVYLIYRTWDSREYIGPLQRFGHWLINSFIYYLIWMMFTGSSGETPLFFLYQWREKKFTLTTYMPQFYNLQRTFSRASLSLYSIWYQDQCSYKSSTHFSQRATSCGLQIKSLCKLIRFCFFISSQQLFIKVIILWGVCWTGKGGVVPIPRSATMRW